VLGEGAGARALPVVRIAAPEGKYDYQNKYFTDEVRYLVPAAWPRARRPRSGASRWPPTGRSTAAAGAVPT
jgi:D-alanine-D-alanine ligase-like ATP-grasp enzyme